MKQKKLHISFDLDISLLDDDKIRKPALKAEFEDYGGYVCDMWMPIPKFNE